MKQAKKTTRRKTITAKKLKTAAVVKAPQQTSKQLFNFQSLSAFVFMMSVGLLALLQVQAVVLPQTQLFSDLIRDPFTSLEARRAQTLGSLYDLNQFILSHTENDDSLAVPPQSKWGEVGNVGYIRYFLFPRYLFHPEDYTDQSRPQIDAYVLAKSYLDPVTQTEQRWPDFPVQAKVIYLFDESSKEVKTLTNVKYDPADPIFDKKWGVIKL